MENTRAFEPIKRLVDFFRQRLAVDEKHPYASRSHTLKTGGVMLPDELVAFHIQEVVSRRRFPVFGREYDVSFLKLRQPHSRESTIVLGSCRGVGLPYAGEVPDRQEHRESHRNRRPESFDARDGDETSSQHDQEIRRV